MGGWLFSVPLKGRVQTGTPVGPKGRAQVCPAVGTLQLSCEEA